MTLYHERNKVIHLGKSNNKEIRKGISHRLYYFRRRNYKKPLRELAQCLIQDKTISGADLESSKDSFAVSIIKIMKTFFLWMRF
jgi:hypothetical protein